MPWLLQRNHKWLCHVSMHLPKPACLLILLLLVSTTISAQVIPERSKRITWSPLRLAEPVNPGFELGYEKLHNDRFAFNVAAAYMFTTYQSYAYTGYRGFRLSAEEKYFVPFGTRNGENYLSAEAVFLSVKYSAIGLFETDTAFNAPVYNDSFRVSKQTYALNLKFGFQLPWKRFVFDFSIGAGLKYKNTKRYDLIDPSDNEQYPRHPNAFFEANKAGGYFTGNFPANIRLMYSF